MTNIARNDLYPVERNYKQNVDLKFLTFPLKPSDFPAQPGAYGIWDFETLGVSGPRLHLLTELSNTHELTLFLTQQELTAFEQQFYEESIESFRKHLPKIKMSHCTAAPLLERAHTKLNIIFAETMKELGLTSKKILNDYFEEVRIATWLTEEWLRYFPLFLKERFPQKSFLYEVAQFEIFRALLDYQDFATQVSTLTGYCYLNPSLQVAHLSQDCPGLQRTAGLWALFRSQNGQSIVEKKLDAFSARFIDHLTEFMTMPEADVVEITQTEFLNLGESIEGLQKCFSQLKLDGIILTEASTATL